ncbi:MAG: class I SAM-dependent rRNA methyltransferase [Verrucomicrobiales bacterium]
MRASCHRLIHGEAEGVPGLIIDQYADRWLVATRDRDAPEWLKPLLMGLGLEAPTVFYKSLSRGNAKEPPVRWWGELPARFVVKEEGVRFEVDLEQGYSSGLFLDQRDNRAWLRERVRELGTGCRVLNLFSYTCSFSVVAAMEGAVTENVDLSKRALEWGQRNMELNQLTRETHFWWATDVRKQLGILQRRQSRFDAIVVDPPTFGRGKRGGKPFVLEDDMPLILKICGELLHARGCLIASCNAERLPSGKLCEWVERVFARDFKCQEVGAPEDHPRAGYWQAVRVWG